MKTNKNLIKLLSGEFPLVSAPYRAMAEKAGMSEKDLIKKIKMLKKRKILKTIRAVPKHQNIGYGTNVMAVWKVSDNGFVKKAKEVIKIDNVSHCYERKRYPGWDFNFYTMIHAKNKPDCLRIVNRIKIITKPVDYKLLFSEKEYKKTGFVI